jgi:hypothetical protein
MAVRVEWIGKAPPDAEEWEDLLRAEYGTAMGTVELWIERVGQVWEITRARETPAAAGPAPTSAEVRQRFAAALRMGGKPVIGEAGAEADMEAVTVDTLMSRAEEQRRRGGSGE